MYYVYLFADLAAELNSLEEAIKYVHNNFNTNEDSLWTVRNENEWMVGFIAKIGDKTQKVGCFQ